MTELCGLSVAVFLQIESLFYIITWIITQKGNDSASRPMGREHLADLLLPSAWNGITGWQQPEPNNSVGWKNVLVWEHPSSSHPGSDPPSVGLLWGSLGCGCPSKTPFSTLTTILTRFCIGFFDVLIETSALGAPFHVFCTFNVSEFGLVPSQLLAILQRQIARPCI